MHRHSYYVLAVSGAVAVLAALAASRAHAIPAFARKYQFSCSTCHAPFPRLKPFGEEFAARGFVLPPDQEPPRATLDVGDPLLTLMRDLPLGVRVDGYASWYEERGGGVDVEWPWSFKVLSGGPIAHRVSYYVYGIFEEGSSPQLEDAYVQFSQIFGLPVDVLVGQFQVCDPLFKRELRLQREDYQIFKTRVGRSNINLAYDRGVVLAWGAPAELDVIAQVVNGNGVGPTLHEAFDDDGFKNTSLRLARQFGPMRVGLFSYLGRSEGAGYRPRNRVRYFGPDLVVDLSDRLQLNLQYLHRRDSNPFHLASHSTSVVTDGGFVELMYLPEGADGRWAFTALYNRVDSGDPAAVYQSVALTATHLMARNLRLVGEAARDLEGKAWRVTAGVTAAF